MGCYKITFKITIWENASKKSESIQNLALNDPENTVWLEDLSILIRANSPSLNSQTICTDFPEFSNFPFLGR